MVKTIKQQKLVKRTIEELAKKKPLNKGKLLEEIGYSKETAKTPGIAYDTKYVRTELESVVKAMEKNRDDAIKSLKGKLEKAQYNHAIQGVDVLTKNIELLKGNATSREETVIEDDAKKKIAKEMLERMAKTS